MAKKSRKPNLPQETLARARAEMYGTTPAAGPAAPAAKPAAGHSPVARPVTRTADLHQQYAYVIKDLRNIMILAGVIILVLVIMSFFI